MTDARDEYERCRFSVTCYTDDLAVAHCLRALCHFAEIGLSHKNIAWTGSGKDEWISAGNMITLRFTHPDNREAFLRAANEVLVPGKWRPVSESNDDPAPKPHRKK